MAGEPTHTELEQKSKELEKETARRRHAEEALRRCEAILGAVVFATKEFLSPGTQEQDVQTVLEQIGTALEVSRVLVFKYHMGAKGKLTANLFLYWTAPGVLPKDDLELTGFSFQAVGLGRWERFFLKGSTIGGIVQKLPNKERAYFSSRGIKSVVGAPIIVGGTCWGHIACDERETERNWSTDEIEAMRTAAEALGAAIHRRNTDDELLKRKEELEIKGNNLENVNTALKVLLNKREEDKEKLEENVFYQVKKLILPYLKKLNESGLNERQKTFVNILDSGLQEIISPFSRRLSLSSASLSPTELVVANLIKQGKTTKEIAALLNLSSKTIEAFRRHIRRKLGIKNQKVNLKNYLLSMTS